MRGRLTSPGVARRAATSAPWRARRPSIEHLEGRTLLSGNEPTVSISASPVNTFVDNTVPEVFAVTLSAPSSKPVEVTYATADVRGDETATAGQDYVPIAPTTLIFAPGRTVLDVSAVAYLEPDLSEDLTFSVNLTGAVNATLASGQTSGIATVLPYKAAPDTLVPEAGNPSNDPGLPPFVSISPAQLAASANGTSDASFLVALSHSYNETVAVNYATADGSAAAPGDYVATGPDTLEFAVGQTEQTIAVTVNAEPPDALVKTFTVNLLSATNASVQTGQATGTIFDPGGSPPPALSLPTVSISTSPANIFFDNTTSEEFAVSLSTPSSVPVEVTCATADGAGPNGAIAGQDYVQVPPTTLIFAPGQTMLDVFVVGYLEPDITVPKTFTVNLSDPVNATLASNETSGTATVLPYSGSLAAGDPATNPNVAPFVTISPAEVSAANSGTVDATFLVNLTHSSSQTVTVGYATADGTATEGVDYVAIPSMELIFIPGQTEQNIVVAISREPDDGLVKTFTINVFGFLNASIETGQAIGTINDPTSPPTSPSPTPTPTPTPTRTPTAAPTFVTGTFSSSRKGKKTTHSDQLFFSAPLAPASAANRTNYRVTQRISKRKTSSVPVLTATYSATDNSVTLTLGSRKPGKALQVTVSGLVGADGAAVGTFVTNL